MSKHTKSKKRMVVIFIAMICFVGIGILIWQLTTNNNPDGSPGNWTSSQKTTFQQHIKMSDTSGFLNQQLLECMTTFISTKYSYTTAMTDDISTDDRNLMGDTCIGSSAGNWTDAFKSIMIQQMKDQSPKMTIECATCVINAVSEKYSPMDFLKIVQNPTDEYTKFIYQTAAKCVLSKQCTDS